MDSIISLFSSFTSEELTYRKLGELTRNINVNQIQFSTNPEEYEKSDASDYYRKIYTLEPLEIAVLYWPPLAESAVHFHSGFYGYVVVLDGSGENIEYRLSEGVMAEKRRILCTKSGIMNEPDGTIHKIRNASSTEPLITLHLYVPALANLDGLELYDLENKKIGILNEKALNASFNEPLAHFHTIKENAFETISPKEQKGKSHFVYPLVPKPDEAQINKLLEGYYNEQAQKYDQFDTEHASRQAYNKAINSLIAEDFSTLKPLRVLDIAGGTGRRSEEIRSLCNQEYQPVIVDMSHNMIAEAQKRGLQGINSHYLDARLPKDHFDAVYFLYAFGHISSHDLRVLTLERIFNQLKKGGRFYFDVFNIDNPHEWGNSARKTYFDLELNHMNYEEGDIFYKKAGGTEIAFLHYFKRERLIELVEKTGFKIIRIAQIGYVNNPGEICSRPNEGNLFFILEK